MMRALLLIPLLAACTHDLDRTDELEIQRINQEARRAFGDDDLERARALYAEVLEHDPTQPEASAGWALADLLLIATSAPVTEFLDRCNQPHFDIETAIFGDDGLLAKEDRAGLGTIDLMTTYRPTEGAADATIPWNHPTVRTETFIDYENGANRVLLVIVRDGESERSLELRFNLDDAFRDDGAVTELVSGLAASLDELDGTVSVFELLDAGGSGEVSPVPPRGFLRFDEVGDRIAIQLIDVVVPGFCAQPGCSATYSVRGRIEDEVSIIEIPEDEYPFGTAHAIVGPPFTQEFTVAVDRCGPLDDAFVTARVRALGDVLELEAERFHSAAAVDTFAFTLPMRLFHIDLDLPFNAADAAAFEAVTYAAAALTEMASQYRWWDGDLHALVEEFMRGGNEVRDFDPNRTAANILDYTLLPKPDFDLGRTRDRFDRALAAFDRALTLEPQAPGVFDFRNLVIRGLADQYAEYARAVRASITSDQPITTGVAPDYQLHLRRLFEDPPERSNLEERLGEPLVTVTPDPYELVFSEALTEEFPSVLGDAVKTSSVTPYLFSKNALETMIDEANGSWPRFVNLLVRDILEFSL